jgi:hypothetical protein
VEVARELLAAYPEYPGCVYVQNLYVDYRHVISLARVSCEPVYSPLVLLGCRTGADFHALPKTMGGEVEEWPPLPNSHWEFDLFTLP